MTGPMLRHLGARVAMLVLAGSALCLIALLGASQPAQAQGTCLPGATFDVSNQTEFNEAISCNNSGAPNITIRLTTDIVATAVGTDAVFTVIQNEGLIVEGRGFTIRRSTAASTDRLPLLAMIGESGLAGGPGLNAAGFDSTGAVQLIDLNIVVGPHETMGLLHDSPGRLTVRSSSIVGAPGSTATGIVSLSDNTFVLENSLIEQVAAGVNLSGEFFGLILNSTVHSTFADVVSPDAQGPNLVLNSTLAGPIGIEIGTSSVIVENSTVLGDAAALAPGTTGILGSVTFKSSIANTCSADELPLDATFGPGWADLGANAGACFAGSAPVTGLSLETVECTQPTPVGCVPTAAIDAASSARDVGDCSESRLGDLVETDQRGMRRDPAGPGCDAGAYEFGCSGDTSIFDVETTADLNAAIDCLNLIDGAPSSLDRTVIVSLQDNIETSTVATGAVFEPIAQPQPSVLLIEGNGHALLRGASAPTTPLPVLQATEISDTLVSLNDLVIEVGPNDTRGVQYLGRAELNIERSAIVGVNPNPLSVGIEVSTAESTGTSTLENSIVADVPNGVLVDGTPFATLMSITQSTLSSLATDIFVASSNVEVRSSTLAGPVGLEIDADAYGVFDYSTILGDGAFIGPSSNGGVAFRSSIVGSCSAPFGLGLPASQDDGGNVGGCFFGGQEIDTTLADNGCENGTATPIGCPQTVALSDNALARGSGNCASPGTQTDQRGIARTPSGLGCDSGAFEAPCPSSTSTSVESIGQLNSAITCFNSATVPGDYTISLLNGLSASDITITDIDQPVAGFSLTIDGDGNAIFESESPGIGAGPPPLNALLTMTPANRASVQVRDIEIGIALRASSEYLVWNQSPATVTVVDSQLQNIERVTLRSTGGGATIVEGSYLGSGGPSIDQDAGEVQVSATTITSFGGTIGVVMPLAGTLTVDNSTFVNAAILIDPPVTAVVRNSTFAGLGLAGTGQIAVQSSIVDDCNAAVVDNGGNVGGCFDTPVTLGQPDADACVVDRPIPCPPTIEIDTSSIAAGAGDCTGVATDQRGKARTPAGPGCDAGAFETPCTTSRFDAATVAQFNLAIDCFNASTESAFFEVVLLADLELTEFRDGQDALTSVIDNQDFGSSLLIDGNGFTMSEPERTRSTPTSPAPATSLIGLGAGNQAPVELRDIVLETGPDSETPLLVWNQSQATVVVRRSTLRGQATTGPSAALHAVFGGPLVVDSSIIDAWGNGVNMQDGQLTIRNSTFASGPSATGIGVALGGPALLEITNSTFDERSVLIAGPVSGVMRHSTMRGAGISEGATFDVLSSIVPTCGSSISDLGNNVGDCFGTPVTLDAATDNGCLQPTPTGCPGTIALSANSPAIGAGRCEFIVTDQRGVDRSPAGVGCDAGAFERTEGSLGDVTDNGTVDNADVQALLVWFAGGAEPVALAAGDVTGDGDVDLADALAIAQLIAG